MSHRESRDSDSKRHRPRFDRESSPKRSRRDRKPVQERNDLDSRDQTNELPIESQFSTDSKLESGSRSKESSRKSEVDHEGKKHSSNPTEGIRPQSHFQHDEQVGRSSARGATGERGWWRDPRDQRNGKAENKNATNETWRRSDNIKIESDNARPASKRPAFRENKTELEDSGRGEKASGEFLKPTRQEESRREERGRRGDRHLDRPSRATNRRELQRAGVPWRGRNQRDSGDYGRGDRFGVGPGIYSSGGGGSGAGRGEKWKHDLYRDSDKSPTPKNEEDQIAKVEALLAS